MRIVHSKSLITLLSLSTASIVKSTASHTDTVSGFTVNSKWSIVAAKIVWTLNVVTRIQTAFRIFFIMLKRSE